MHVVRWNQVLSRLAIVGMLIMQGCGGGATNQAGPRSLPPTTTGSSVAPSASMSAALSKPRLVAAVGDSQAQLRRSARSAEKSGKIPVYLTVKAAHKTYGFSPFAQIVRSEHALIVRAYSKIFVFPIDEVKVDLHAGSVTHVDENAIPRIAAPKIEQGIKRYERLLAKHRLDKQYHERMIARKQKLCPDCAMFEINPHKFAHMAIVWNGSRDPWQMAATYRAFPVPLSHGVTRLAMGVKNEDSQCPQARTRNARGQDVGGSSGCSGGGGSGGSSWGGSSGGSSSGGSSSGGSSGSSSSGSSCSSGSSSGGSSGGSLFDGKNQRGAHGRNARSRFHAADCGPKKGCSNRDKTAGTALDNAINNNPNLLNANSNQEAYGYIYEDSSGNYYYVDGGTVDLNGNGQAGIPLPPDEPGMNPVGWYHTHPYDPGADGGMQIDQFTGNEFSVADLNFDPSLTAYVAVNNPNEPGGQPYPQVYSDTNGQVTDQGAVGSEKMLRRTLSAEDGGPMMNRTMIATRTFATLAAVVVGSACLLLHDARPAQADLTKTTLVYGPLMVAMVDGYDKWVAGPLKGQTPDPSAFKATVDATADPYTIKFAATSGHSLPGETYDIPAADVLDPSWPSVPSAYVPKFPKGPVTLTGTYVRAFVSAYNVHRPLKKTLGDAFAYGTSNGSGVAISTVSDKNRRPRRIRTKIQADDEEDLLRVLQGTAVPRQHVDVQGDRYPDGLSGVRGYRPSARAILALGAIALGSVSCVARPVARAPSPIHHIVLIVQENRSFDNLFHGFPGADTVDYGYDHTGAKVPLRPVSLTVDYDINHGFRAFMRAYDNGKMDGFDLVHAGTGPRADGPETLQPHPQYRYVEHAEIAPYFELAHRYALADRMFQSNMDQSFAAHLYLIAGQAGNAVNVPSGRPWGCDAWPASRVHTIDAARKPAHSVFPCFGFTTLGDELDARNLTWRYYAPHLDPAPRWIDFMRARRLGSVDTIDRNERRAPDFGQVWSAYDAIDHIRYGPDWATNVGLADAPDILRHRARRSRGDDLDRADVEELRPFAVA